MVFVHGLVCAWGLLLQADPAREKWGPRVPAMVFYDQSGHGTRAKLRPRPTHDQLGQDLESVLAEVAARGGDRVGRPLDGGMTCYRMPAVPRAVGRLIVGVRR